MIEVSDFKKGLCLSYKGAPVMIVDVTFSTPTARGGATIAKTKFRNLLNGQLTSDSIRSGEKFDEVDYEQRKVSYLYADGTHWHFMDAETFEQFALDGELLGERAGYLKEGLEGMKSLVVEGRIVDVVLPNTVDLTVTEADPHIKGATAQAQLKRCVVETGLEVQVPSYVTAGEKIRIDTRDGHFVERVKD